MRATISSSTSSIHLRLSIFSIDTSDTPFTTNLSADRHSVDGSSEKIVAGRTEDVVGIYIEVSHELPQPRQQHFRSKILTLQKYLAAERRVSPLAPELA